MRFRPILMAGALIRTTELHCFHMRYKSPFYSAAYTEVTATVRLVLLLVACHATGVRARS
jgi:hypothetical protein